MARKDWYLTTWESADLVHTAIMAWADGDDERLKRSLDTLRQFRTWLEQQLEEERLNYRARPYEYNMPVEEAPYVVHWEKQLSQCQLWIEFLHDKMIESVMA